MKRKLKLKRNVKIVLALIVALLTMVTVLTIALNRWDKISNNCDNKLGRTCSYYEMMRNK